MPPGCLAPAGVGREPGTVGVHVYVCVHHPHAPTRHTRTCTTRCPTRARIQVVGSAIRDRLHRKKGDGEGAERKSKKSKKKQNLKSNKK